MLQYVLVRQCKKMNGRFNGHRTDFNCLGRHRFLKFYLDIFMQIFPKMLLTMSKIRKAREQWKNINRCHRCLMHFPWEATREAQDCKAANSLFLKFKQRNW